MLAARSEELLKGLLEKYGSTPTKHDIFKGLLKSKLGDKFRRMQRKRQPVGFSLVCFLSHRWIKPAITLAAFVQSGKSGLLNRLPPW